MDFIVTLLVGALIGWLASIVTHTDEQFGAFANILVGIIGAALGRWLFGSVLGIGTATAAGAFSLFGILWGVVGAVVLISIIKAFRHHA